ncbi:MAG: peptidylprolyl isomerase, partial [Bacteroidota bacterium]
FLGAAPEAGTVAGQTVSSQEYGERVSNALGQYGNPTGPQAGQIRDQVWNQMVSEILLDKEMEKVGLEITGEELYDMFAGEEISPIVRNYLLQPGQEYDQAQMQLLLEQITENDQQAEQLRNLEEFAARVRAQERYTNMIKAAFVGSSSAAKRQYEEQNKTSSLSFLAVNYTAIPDSSIPVSDGEITSYIRSHEKQYKQDAETFIRYARFQLLPSVKDSAKARANVLKRKESFAATSNDSIYTSTKSSQPYSGPNFRTLSQLPEYVREDIRSAGDKEVLGPYREGGTYRLVKLIGTESAETSAAKINHILITYKGDTAAAQSKARDLAGQARGGASFATLASENSDDFRSRSQGGSLGWYNPGQFGEDFDDAINKAGTGSIVGPIKGPGGFHVVQIVDKDSKGYDVAQIEENIIFTTPTRDSVYGAANLFAQHLIQSNDINKVGTEDNIVVLESNPLTDKTLDVLGLNGGRELVLWAVNSEMGDISKVLRINDNYIVAQVTGKNDEGLKTADQVRDEVAALVRKEKKAKQIIDKLNGIAGQDLNAMKDAYGAGAFVSTAENISFNSPSIPGIGADKFILGRAVSLDQGEISKPLEGTNGVYVLQATGVNAPADPDEGVLNSLKTTIANQGQAGLQNNLNGAMVDAADVDDNRSVGEALNFGIRR